MAERRLPPHLRGRAQPTTEAQQPLPPNPQPTPVPPKPVEQIQNRQPINRPVTTQPQPPAPQPQPQPQPQPEQIRKTSRIDTEQIPRPIIRSETTTQIQIFNTAPVPLYHPPSSHEYFITQDGCNAGPRYIRSTMYAIGNEPAITQQTEIPLGLIIQPMNENLIDEEQLPIVEFQNEPIRCSRCKAYINPFSQFVDQGNNYNCNICKMKNAVPLDYYSPLTQGNQRADRAMRPELNRGAYEILAPPDYIKKKIDNILILFCIELTQACAIKGVYQQIISSIQQTLDAIPNPERTDIAFLTFDSRIQFYNIPTNLASEPQIIVVGELDEANVPLPKEKLFLNIQEHRDKIDYMLEKLQNYKPNVSKNQAVAVGTVLQNAVTLLDNRSGRILYFGCTPPTQGYGKVLPKRVDNKLYGTDNEKTLYQPADQAYINLGKQCLKNFISVDLFVFNDDSFELATVAPISNLTGGSIYHYPFYNKVINGSELHYAIYRNLSRSYAYDCIMTVRTSTGIILYDYYTGSGKLSVRDLQLSTIDADKSIAVMLKHEEKIMESEAYVQYALLYTNIYSERLIRIFNLSLQVVNKTNGNNPWHNIFKTADFDALCLLLIRKNLPFLLSNSLKFVRDQLFANLVSVLHSYRKWCSSSSPQGQLILPEAIKILPLYIQTLNKRDILKSGIVKPDLRIYELHLLLTQTINYINNFLYPKLYPIVKTQKIDDLFIGDMTEDERVLMPTNVTTSIEKVKSDGIYILDTSQYIYIFIGLAVPSDLLSEVINIYNQIFNINSLQDLDQDAELPLTENPLNVRLNNIINQLRTFKGGAYHPVKIIRQNSGSAVQFTSKLFEDELQVEKGYGDYLCEIHAAIQAKGI